MITRLWLFLRSALDLLHVFDNPYFYSAAVAARLTVNAATILWAIITLCDPASFFNSLPNRTFLLRHVDGVITASVLLTIAICHIVWLVLRLPPLRWGRFVWGCSGYLLLAMFWSYLPISVIVGDAPLRPIAFSAALPIAILGFFGFLANPKVVPRESI